MSDSAVQANDLIGRTAITAIVRRLIPFLCLLFIVNYLDRTNIAMAKLRMLHDLNLSDDAYGSGAGLFFVGYFLFEVPSNLILHRVARTAMDRAHHDFLGNYLRRHGAHARAGEFLCAAVPAGRGGGGIFPRHRSLSELLDPRASRPACSRCFSPPRPFPASSAIPWRVG